MSVPTIFFIHGENTIFEVNKSYFDFINQDNYDLYCSETNEDPYSLADNIEYIITMQCGHYTHKNMLNTHIFPSFPLYCDSKDCLDNDGHNCSVCQNNCVFVCDLCSNFISEPKTVKSVIDYGIENIIKYNSEQFNDRKRKFEYTNDTNDNTNFFSKMKKN
jgi:hypothetical protein